MRQPRPSRAPAVIRAMAIGRMRQRLEHEGFPRLQMALIVALTGAVGLLSSYTLLQQGLHSMALRYPLALTLAYGVFLLLIWLWLRTSADDWRDAPNGADLPWSPRGGSSGGGSPPMESGGGDFSGGGASASFDGGTAWPGGGELPEPTDTLPSAGEAIGAMAEGEELAIPLMVLALAAGMALASLYVVYIAPMLLAEVLVDGALSYALYRHLREQDRQHWLRGVLGHTAWSFAATALFLALLGWGMAVYAPGAQSIGEVVAHARLMR